MWKKLKEYVKQNGLKWAVALLGLLFGADQVNTHLLTEGTTKEIKTPTPVVDYWTVTAWFVAEKQTNNQGQPSVRYTDNLGLYTVKVKSPKHPTTAQIVEAQGGGLNADAITLKMVEVIPPDKTDETEEQTE